MAFDRVIFTGTERVDPATVLHGLSLDIALIIELLRDTTGCVSRRKELLDAAALSLTRTSNTLTDISRNI